MAKPLKIKELSKYISSVLKKDAILSNIYVQGEVSNFMKSSTGHIYFSLKDESAMIRCIIFKNMDIAKTCFLKDGDKVIVNGSITTYDMGSYYQILVKNIEEDGVGDIYQKYEKLKMKLYEEGLFDDDVKKDIPKFCKNIGVVTSPTGAAVKDIIKTVKRRFPISNIIIYPSPVQGDDAPKYLFKALDYLDSRGDMDVIIIGRGGGSFEDLNAFNDENLVRRIYEANTPIISAVGHEIDNMLTDYVADLRAPTPTAAGELVTPNISELLETFDSIEKTINNKIKSSFKDEYVYLEYLEKELHHYNPKDKIDSMVENLDKLEEKIFFYYDRQFTKKLNELNTLGEKLFRYNPEDKLKILNNNLDAYYEKLNSTYKIFIKSENYKIDNLRDKLKILNSDNILKKGYAKICQNTKFINSVKDIDDKQNISLYMKDGKLLANVIEKEIFDGE